MTNEVKGNKCKGFKFFDKGFYSLEQAKCWGVRLTFKLPMNIEKSARLEACLAFGVPPQFFVGIPQGHGLVRTLYTRVEKGTVRVKCLAQDQNAT